MKKILLLALLLLSSAAFAEDNSMRIKDALNQFVADWNQGNMKGAMTIYKNSSDALLISDKVIKGNKNIVKFWQSSYPTKASMGVMHFSDIQVKPLCPRYALAIGKWTLVNSGSGDTGGIFTVLFENTNHGWKSVVDHTTGL